MESVDKVSETWTEKYRPKTLDEVVGHDEIIRSFKSFINKQEMPNILLTGPPGVGKTALIVAFGREFYGEYFDDNFTEMNSSDDRGVDTVRGPIKSFADFAPDGPFEFKMLYLGEMDGLTKDAQDALKRTIETSAHSVRFIADCNNKEGLIAAIQSRFVRIHVGNPPTDDCLKRLAHIATEEELNIKVQATYQVYHSAKGDLRAAIELLQSLPQDGEEVTAEFIRNLSPTVSSVHVVNLWETLNETDDYKHREEVIINCMNESSWDALGILDNLYTIIENIDIDIGTKCQLMECIGEYMWRVSQPCNKLIQLRGCIMNLQRILGV